MTLLFYIAGGALMWSHLMAISRIFSLEHPFENVPVVQELHPKATLYGAVILWPLVVFLMALFTLLGRDADDVFGS